MWSSLGFSSLKGGHCWSATAAEGHWLPEALVVVQGTLLSLLHVSLLVRWTEHGRPTKTCGEEARRLGDEAVAAAGAGATTPLSAAEPQLGMILCGSSVVRGGEVAAHCWPRQGWIGRVKSRATHGHTTTLSHTRRHCATYQATLGR